MYKFSKHSLKQLKTCDIRLQLIAESAIKIVDFSILEGIRTIERQKELFVQGKSKSLNSKHLPDKNKKSKAFDILPYPCHAIDDVDNRERFALLAGIIIGIGHEMGVKIRWGGDWDRVFDPKKCKFYDALHFEIIEVDGHE